MPSTKLCGFCRAPKELVGTCLGEPICTECTEVYGESYQIRKGDP